MYKTFETSKNYRKKNVEGTSVLFIITARKKGTNLRLADSPLTSIPDHLTGGTTLRARENAEYLKRK